MAETRGGRPGAGRPAGRGRADTPGVRTASRPSSQRGPAKQKPTEPETGLLGGAGASLAPRWRHGLRLTQRAIILGVVIVVLLVSYATTLRVHFNQQYALAQTRQQIAEHEASISSLEDEIARWQDPEYVKTQARERLGWVLPGEIGFRVIGPDGQPYGGGSQIGAAQLPEGEYAKTWWDRMWNSVTVADEPVPVSPDQAPPQQVPAPTEGP